MEKSIDNKNESCRNLVAIIVAGDSLSWQIKNIEEQQRIWDKRKKDLLVKLKQNNQILIGDTFSNLKAKLKSQMKDVEKNQIFLHEQMEKLIAKKKM